MMLQFGASLTDDTRSVNYDRNTFIIKATDLFEWSTKRLTKRLKTISSTWCFVNPCKSAWCWPGYDWLTKWYSANGLYYKHVMIVMAIVSHAGKWCHNLEHHSRGLVYDRMFSVPKSNCNCVYNYGITYGQYSIPMIVIYDIHYACHKFYHDHRMGLLMC
jgi:hypothetical protein